MEIQFKPIESTRKHRAWPLGDSLSASKFTKVSRLANHGQVGAFVAAE
jgi:hypothetical protein